MKSRQQIQASEVKTDINRELKGQPLSESSIALLKELHLLTNQGQLNADARRKIKQVNHLYNLIAPALKDLHQRFSEIQIVDVGAGKAYLGFMLYEIALKNLEGAKIISVEERLELVASGEAMAKRMGFSRMQFIAARISEAEILGHTHLVTALHACDTATDDALILGLEQAADYIAVVPCCQAEMAQLLKNENTTDLLELYRHGIHRREFGSHLTNVLRSLVLEALGYQVTVTELVGWEHSLKNEFIFAKRIQKENKLARVRLDKLLLAIPVQPKIVRYYHSRSL